MLPITQAIGKSPISNIVHDCPPPVTTYKDLDKEFFNDLKVIIKATRTIKNQSVNQKILEFYLSALVAKYAENKISCLIETNLIKTLNQLFHYGRESEFSTS
jgi:hypothetical protein